MPSPARNDSLALLARAQGSPPEPACKGGGPGHPVRATRVDHEKYIRSFEETVYDAKLCFVYLFTDAEYFFQRVVEGLKHHHANLDVSNPAEALTHLKHNTDQALRWDLYYDVISSIARREIREFVLWSDIVSFLKVASDVKCTADHDKVQEHVHQSLSMIVKEYLRHILCEFVGRGIMVSAPQIRQLYVRTGEKWEVLDDEGFLNKTIDDFPDLGIRMKPTLGLDFTRPEIEKTRLIVKFIVEALRKSIEAEDVNLVAGVVYMIYELCHGLPQEYKTDTIVDMIDEVKVMMDLIGDLERVREDRQAGTTAPTSIRTNSTTDDSPPSVTSEGTPSMFSRPTADSIINTSIDTFVTTFYSTLPSRSNARFPNNSAPSPPGQRKRRPAFEHSDTREAGIWKTYHYTGQVSSLLGLRHLDKFHYEEWDTIPKEHYLRMYSWIDSFGQPDDKGQPRHSNAEMSFELYQFAQGVLEHLRTQTFPNRLPTMGSMIPRAHKIRKEFTGKNLAVIHKGLMDSLTVVFKWRKPKKPKKKVVWDVEAPLMPEARARKKLEEEGKRKKEEELEQKEERERRAAEAARALDEAAAESSDSTTEAVESWEDAVGGPDNNAQSEDDRNTACLKSEAEVGGYDESAPFEVDPDGVSVDEPRTEEECDVEEWASAIDDTPRENNADDVASVMDDSPHENDTDEPWDSTTDDGHSGNSSPIGEEYHDSDDESPIEPEPEGWTLNPSVKLDAWNHETAPTALTGDTADPDEEFLPTEDDRGRVPRRHWDNLEILFHAKAGGSMTWPDFEGVMRQLGYEALQGAGGSSVKFSWTPACRWEMTAGNKAKGMGAVVFHRVHHNKAMRPHYLRDFSRSLRGKGITFEFIKQYYRPR